MIYYGEVLIDEDDLRREGYIHKSELNKEMESRHISDKVPENFKILVKKIIADTESGDVGFVEGLQKIKELVT